MPSSRCSRNSEINTSTNISKHDKVAKDSQGLPHGILRAQSGHNRGCCLIVPKPLCVWASFSTPLSKTKTHTGKVKKTRRQQTTLLNPHKQMYFYSYSYLNTFIPFSIFVIDKIFVYMYSYLFMDKIVKNKFCL